LVYKFFFCEKSIFLNILECLIFNFLFKKDEAIDGQLEDEDQIKENKKGRKNKDLGDENLDEF
jgi:hypothetical protein